MPTFWRMNEKPTAVISGASFGALRKRAVADALDHRVEHPAGDHRDHEHAEQPDGEADDRVPGGEAEGPVEAHGRERPDHEQVAVGEVDQLDDPVDERVAERDQRPDRAVREPVLEVACEPREVTRRC